MSILEAFRERILQMWRYSSSDISNAESENVLRDQSALLRRLDQIGTGAREANANLRGAIAATRLSAQAVTRHAPDAMAQMIHSMKAGHRHE